MLHIKFLLFIWLSIGKVYFKTLQLEWMLIRNQFSPKEWSVWRHWFDLFWGFLIGFWYFSWGIHISQELRGKLILHAVLVRSSHALFRWLLDWRHTSINILRRFCWGDRGCSIFRQGFSQKFELFLMPHILFTLEVKDWDFRLKCRCFLHVLLLT